METSRFAQIVGLAATMGLAVCLPEAAHANLVTNGGFETGDLTGWTQSGNRSLTGVTVDPVLVHSGTWGARLGPPFTEGFLTQDIATEAGQTYNVSLWLRNPGGTPNSFTASFGVGAGSTVVPQLTNAVAFPYTFHSASILATAAVTTLTIGGFRHDPSFWGLDDVDVSLVPLPAALPLLASGLLGLGAVGWRRRKGAVAAA